MAQTVKGLKFLLWKIPLYLLVIWALGFILFYTTIDSVEGESTERADAILVWTGGAGRITTAVNLLKAGRAERLLVSGVHPDVADTDITSMTNTAQILSECCIDLDHTARNTLGNARESAAWARSHNFDTLILVTADYHMPRSLILMRRAMPEAKIIPDRVKSNASLRYLVVEYNKYLITLLRIV
ncbi:membrane protein [Kordiimonas sediminis]|uniref:Membrane protein n=1 Tax=Kordiimonas sediminis TaxID=1735581 RepID=A0A919AKC4_9PROT|nr:YdcF family protein [Kordiimonas sediminis]GHF11720.1 membrane protein [Kordiimonas sediminis]